jgi:hypothetical protein
MIGTIVVGIVGCQVRRRRQDRRLMPVHSCSVVSISDDRPAPEVTRRRLTILLTIESVEEFDLLCDVARASLGP